jgi:flagellar biosynthesis component FlhA
VRLDLAPEYPRKGVQSMIVLGLLLLVAAVVVTIGIVTSHTVSTHLDLFNSQVIDKFSTGELFVLGIITGIVGLLGLFLLLGGTRRAGRKRRELRTERKSKRQRERELREENARLAEQLERERATGNVTTADGTAGGTAAAGTTSADADRRLADEGGTRAGDDGYLDQSAEDRRLVDERTAGRHHPDLDPPGSANR